MCLVMILSIIMAIGIIPAMFAPYHYECDLREFASVNQLERWLEINPVSYTIYIFQSEDGPYYGDCDDYAFELIKDARKEGYDLQFYPAKTTKKGVSHAMCVIIIGNEYYFIEPQTDEVTLGGLID